MRREPCACLPPSRRTSRPPQGRSWQPWPTESYSWKISIPSLGHVRLPAPAQAITRCCQREPKDVRPRRHRRTPFLAHPRATVGGRPRRLRATPTRMSAAIGGSKLLRQSLCRSHLGADRSGDRHDRTSCLAEGAVCPWHAGPDRRDQAPGQAGTRSRSASDPESVVDQESTRFPSGALGCLLALLGQRRGQCSALFYLVLP